MNRFLFLLLLAVSFSLSFSLLIVSCSCAADWQLVWQDEFNRSEVGDGWIMPRGTSASIEDGRLLLEGGGATLITQRGFKADVRIEFDAEAKPGVPPCDLSATIGANTVHGYGYLFAFGGQSNQKNQLLGRGVHQVVDDPPFLIEHGKVYHMVAQKEGRHLTYTVDGVTILDAESDDPLGGPGFDRVGLVTWAGMYVDHFKVYERSEPHPDTPDYPYSLPETPLYRDGRKLVIRQAARLSSNAEAAVDAFNRGDLDAALKLFQAMGDDRIGLVGQVYVICDLGYQEKQQYWLDRENEDFRKLADTLASAAKANPNDEVISAYAKAARYLPELIMSRSGLTAAIRLVGLGEENNPFYPKARLYHARYHYWNGAEGGSGKIKGEACSWMAELKETWPEHTILKQYTGEPVPWGEELNADTENHPAWAAYLREAYARNIRVMERFFTERQAPDGQLGGGYGDDVELMRTWMQIAGISTGAEPVRAGVQRLTEGVWNVLYKGYSRGCGDVEHSAEPSADTLPTMLFVRYGDPLWVERNLRSCHTIKGLFMGIDKKGYPRFKSTEFGTEGVNTNTRGGGDTGYHARAMKHFIWAAWWGDPQAKDWFVRWCDGWRATTMAQIDTKIPGFVPGTIWYPSGEIFPPADAPWYSPHWNYYGCPGLGGMIHDSFLCAYYLTRDPKFLKPFQLAMDMAASGPLTSGAVPPSERWQVENTFHMADSQKTSLYKWLTEERVYDEYTMRIGKAVEKYRVNYDLDKFMGRFEGLAKGQRNNLELQTTEVLSTDRAALGGATDVFGAYTGAICHLRDAATPTFAVTYETADTDFAAVVTEATTKRIRLWLYSFHDQPTKIGLQLWMLEPGEYILNQGKVLKGEYEFQHRYGWTDPQRVKVTHRADTVYVDVPPCTEWAVDLRLDVPISVPSTAPDLAINARDFKWTDNGLRVKVHNIGNADSAPSQILLQVQRGPFWQDVGQATVPAIRAVRDYEVTKNDVVIKPDMPVNVKMGYRAVIDPDDEQYEICEANNTAVGVAN